MRKVLAIFAALLLVVGLATVADVEIWVNAVTEGTTFITEVLDTPNGYVYEDFFNSGFAIFDKYAYIDGSGLYEEKFIYGDGVTEFYEYSDGPLGYIDEGFFCIGEITMYKELTVDGLYQEEFKNIWGDGLVTDIWTEVGWYNGYVPAVEEVFIDVELFTDTTWDWVMLNSFADPGEWGWFDYETLIFGESFDYFQYVEMDLW
jgi:hypothetical protein